MDNSIREKIKDAILNYCEGITWQEFDINNLDSMVNDIEKVIEGEKETKRYVGEHKRFKDEWGNTDWRDTGEMGG